MQVSENDLFTNQSNSSYVFSALYQFAIIPPNQSTVSMQYCAQSKIKLNPNDHPLETSTHS